MIETSTQVHENTHWLTEGLTSIGQFIAFLRSARDQDLLEAIVRSGEIRALLADARRGPSARSSIFGEWEKTYELPSPTQTKYDGAFQNWFGCFWSELALSNSGNISLSFPCRVGLVAGSLEHYTNWLNQQDYLDNPSFKFEESDDFVRNSVRRGNVLLYPQGRERLQTWSIIEAISVIAELLHAEKTGDYESYAKKRLKALFNTRYLKPIEEIFLLIGCDLDHMNLLEYAASSLTFLEVALNPPIPPLENMDFRQFSWEHLDPVCRLYRALNCRLVGEAVPSGKEPSDAVESFRAKLYKMVDPPGREWQIHLPEHAQFVAFDKLPHRKPLENMYAWAENDKLLSPFDIRLWHALHLRLTLAERGITGIAGAVTNLVHGHPYTTPVITIRGRDLKNRETVPMTSRIFDSSELMEWFLVNSGAQYACIDLLLGRGTLTCFPFESHAGITETYWYEELNARCNALLNGFLDL